MAARNLLPLKKPENADLIVDSKRIWLSVVFVLGLVGAGVTLRQKASDWIFGKNAEARVLNIEERQNILDEKYEHLHEEIRDTRDDLRAMQGGVRLQPLPAETPWPQPHPTETP